MVSFSPTSGRMRYAPTHVRLLSWSNTINHYTCSVVFWDMLVCVFVSFSPTSGRMRYAPTHVRLILGLIGLCVCFVFAHIRAYAIRPYTCSIDFWCLLGWWLVSFSPTSGRMRYAPTPVRLISGGCWVVCLFHIRSLQGVCDTPLHMFVYYRG